MASLHSAHDFLFLVVSTMVFKIEKMADEFNSKGNATHTYVIVTMQEIFDITEYLGEKNLFQNTSETIPFQILNRKGRLLGSPVLLILIYYFTKGTYCCWCSHFLPSKKINWYVKIICIQSEPEPCFFHYFWTLFLSHGLWFWLPSGEFFSEGKKV